MAFKSKKPIGINLQKEKPKEEEIFEPDAKDLTGKYIIKEELGGGNFKTAYLAHSKDDKNKLFVLFKFKKSILSSDNKKEIAIFKRLLKNLKKCYKHVICPIDFGYIIETENNVEKKFFVLVSNFIKGYSLTKFLEDKKYKITEDEKIDIMIGLIKGLDFLHNKLKFVHFDLKPDNIQIQQHKNDLKHSTFDVAIIDLGVGCFNNDDCIWSGTEIYGSPEIINPIVYKFKDPIKQETIIGFGLNKTEPRNWTKIDIYAMGLIFAEILDPKTPIENLKKEIENCKNSETSNNKHSRLKELICKMTDYYFYKRPGTKKIFQILNNIKQNKGFYSKPTSSKTNSKTNSKTSLKSSSKNNIKRRKSA